MLRGIWKKACSEVFGKKHSADFVVPRYLRHCVALHNHPANSKYAVADLFSTNFLCVLTTNSEG